MRVFVTIILDGVGIGSQPDAAAYGDEGSNTLGNVCVVAKPHLPNLARLGLGCIADLDGVPRVAEPAASFGRMTEVSAGKDSTTGHWELAGIALEQPFPVYPGGFPDAVIAHFVERTGVGGVLGNVAASGTDIIAEHGAEHVRTRRPIVYTSADSVFQVAAHVDVFSVEDLYRMCAIARDEVCVGEHAVGRVIARPFTTADELPHDRSRLSRSADPERLVRPADPAPARASGRELRQNAARPSFVRISDKRKDYALPPPSPPIQSRLQSAGVRTVSIGKVADLFAGVGFDETHKTGSNAEGIAAIISALAEAQGNPVAEHASSKPYAFAFPYDHGGSTGTTAATYIWANLISFDQDFGHRNDPDGFARALEEFDAAVPELLAALPEDGALVITADHGNDPTYPGTDHTREHVPLLYYRVGSPGRDLGMRKTFGDHAATVGEFFGVRDRMNGTAFLD